MHPRREEPIFVSVAVALVVTVAIAATITHTKLQKKREMNSFAALAHDGQRHSVASCGCSVFVCDPAVEAVDPWRCLYYGQNHACLPLNRIQAFIPLVHCKSYQSTSLNLHFEICSNFSNLTGRIRLTHRHYPFSCIVVLLCVALRGWALKLNPINQKK